MEAIKALNAIAIVGGALGILIVIIALFKPAFSPYDFGASLLGMFAFFIGFLYVGLKG